MDLQLQLVIVPVSDVDTAKAFYVDRLGFAVHVDHQATEQIRIVQLDPPGSACSITIGTGLGHDMAPGSLRGLHLVVTDIVAARDELVGRGAPVGPIRHMTAQGWADGPDPARANYNSFAEVADPDGNGWVLQEYGHPAADS